MEENTRYYYYLECDVMNDMFKYLDSEKEEGNIEYTVDEINGYIILDNLINDDIIFKKLEQMDLIEDVDRTVFSEEDHSDYLDLYNDEE